RRVGGAIPRRAEGFGQQLNECRNRGHRVSARQRIVVTHFDAVTRIEFGVLREAMKRFARTRIRICKCQRSTAVNRMVYRYEIRAKARLRIALGPRDGLFLLLERLRE